MSEQSDAIFAKLMQMLPSGLERGKTDSENIERLWYQLRHGQYRFPELTSQIRTINGKERVLCDQSYEAKTIQRAVARVLSKDLDASFLPQSMGYRRGCDTFKAVSYLKSQLQSYLPEHPKACILKLDIHKFFDTINHHELRRAMGTFDITPELLYLIEDFLRVCQKANPQGEAMGIAQGSPLAPVLSNIYLHQLDRLLLKNNLIFVRYVDDISIVCPNPSATHRRLVGIQKWIQQKLHLTLNMTEGKTGVNKIHGYTFLGYKFVLSQDNTVRLTLADGALDRQKQTICDNIKRLRKPEDLPKVLARCKDHTIDYRRRLRAVDDPFTAASLERLLLGQLCQRLIKLSGELDVSSICRYFGLSRSRGRELVFLLKKAAENPKAFKLSIRQARKYIQL